MEIFVSGNQHCATVFFFGKSGRAHVETVLKMLDEALLPGRRLYPFADLPTCRQAGSTLRKDSRCAPCPVGHHEPRCTFPETPLLTCHAFYWQHCGKASAAS